MNRAALLIVGLSILVPMDVARAHAPFKGAGSFSGGLLHPLFIPAHVLALVATRLLIGRHVHRWHWLAPASYVVGLAIGFTAIMSAYAPQSAGEALLGATVVCGGPLRLRARCPRFWNVHWRS
jgi:hydrogenase/urease accessory protein HupE